MGAGGGALSCVSSFCCAVKQTTLGVLLVSRDSASPGGSLTSETRNKLGAGERNF